MGPLCGLNLRGGSDYRAPKWKWKCSSVYHAFDVIFIYNGEMRSPSTTLSP